ncbi:hypothetical protein EV651_1234 [Kribbella sp. VKM Ac-2571]|nr:hypothetical protein EV651_1234 [Kribbella sp. VKM Ac-2571]
MEPVSSVVVSPPVAPHLVEAELTIQERWRRMQVRWRVWWHRSSHLPRNMGARAVCSLTTTVHWRAASNRSQSERAFRSLATVSSAQSDLLRRHSRPHRGRSRPGDVIDHAGLGRSRGEGSRQPVSIAPTRPRHRRETPPPSNSATSTPATVATAISTACYVPSPSAPTKYPPLSTPQQRAGGSLCEDSARALPISPSSDSPPAPHGCAVRAQPLPATQPASRMRSR